jgi:type I restriction enzyme S subunit
MMFYKETNFKETPIGKIPKDWEVVMFSDVVNTLPGFAFSSKFFSKEKGIPLIRIRDLGKDSTETFYNGPYEEEYLVEKGDILVSMDGEFNVCLWKGPSGLLNQRVMKIWPKCKEKLDALYLYYGSQKPLKSFEYQIAATTVKHLLTEHFRLIKIPLPTEIKEQQKIAEILSTVDEAIQKTNEIIAKTERLKKGLMQELLTKGIGHKEFKDTEIGRIPKDWEVVKLGEIGTFQYGITTSAKEEDTGLKLLRITDIRDDGTINWSEVPFCEISLSELSKYMLKVGDVLFARIGATTGKTCYINQEIRAVFGSYLIRFLPDVNSQINTKFLHLFTQSEMYWSQVNRMKGGQLKKGLNTQLLKEIKILLPPLEEQQKIAQVLSTVDKKLEIERNEKAKLEKIKQGLMDLLLTGKIRVKVNQHVP